MACTITRVGAESGREGSSVISDFLSRELCLFGHYQPTYQPTNQPTLLTHPPTHSLHERVLLEKLTVTQLVKQVTLFYGTWIFTIVFAKARYWSVCWIRCIHSNIIFPPIPKSSVWTLSGFATRIFYAYLIFTMRSICPSHLTFLVLTTLIMLFILHFATNFRWLKKTTEDPQKA
jgi:hypothetical protein